VFKLTSEQSTPARPVAHVHEPSACDEGTDAFENTGLFVYLVGVQLAQSENTYWRALCWACTCWILPHTDRKHFRCCNHGDRRSRFARPRGAERTLAPPEESWRPVNWTSAACISQKGLRREKEPPVESTAKVQSSKSRAIDMYVCICRHVMSL
jgi:hypothetical protein